MTFTSGAFKRYVQGTVTANGTSDVTFSHPSIGPGAVVFLALNSASGSASGNAFVHDRSDSTNTITVLSVANDASVYDVIVFP